MSRRWIAVGAAAAALAAAAPAASAHAAHRGFTARVSNPYYPLAPGMRWEYRGVKDGRPLRDVVFVTHRTERIAGVRCAVVVDRGYVDGRLAESTVDWFSQDGSGTVWYFGEATKELDRHGHVTSTEGSWRAGTDGARQGIFMPASPRVGSPSRRSTIPATPRTALRSSAARRRSPSRTGPSAGAR